MPTIDYDCYLTTPQEQIFDTTPEEARFVVVPKGRRFGATHGAGKITIQWLLQGFKILWGDTIHSNIDRYIERYFLPDIIKYKLPITFNKQSKQLRCDLTGGYADFRSSDNPENWEGFGYDKIFLNEAGIILKNEYLFTNAVLPMMMDYPNSQLFAIGTPKGKKRKDGSPHRFYMLAQAALEGRKSYKYFQFSSYDNPLLSNDDIDTLKAEIAAMSPDMVRQEIYGEFIDSVDGQLFAYNFDKEAHTGKCSYKSGLQTFVCLDFNIQPFAATIIQREGVDIRLVDEVDIKTGSIPEMASRLLTLLGSDLANSFFTGDYTGGKRSIEHSDNASLWLQLQRIMKFGQKQLIISPNPQHKTSREDCNYFLYHYHDFVISDKCQNIINDLETVQVDAQGKLLKSDRSKSAQRADFLDTFRYFVHNVMNDWVKHHRKTGGKKGDGYIPTIDLKKIIPKNIYDK